MVLLQAEELRTLVVGVTLFQSCFNLNVQLVIAGLVLAMLPMRVRYPAGQRLCGPGLTTKAAKG